jgi:tetraacyldisaccharide 4'-kinase
MKRAAMRGAAASLRVRIARELERGAWRGPFAGVAARAWGAWSARTIARPLTWSEGVRLVAVGGATLGGSGKTPLAIACARTLSEVAGARVAFVGHAYGATPREAGEVPVVDRVTEDALAAFGDEALLAARALAGRARVVVGPTRQAAVDHAARIADVVVVDGVLQTKPRRANLSLLALDATSPWGAGATPPRGDLRAPRQALLDACDRAVLIGDDPAASACVKSRGARLGGVTLAWIDLFRVRVGLFTTLARPSRLLAFLARRGVVPARVVRVPDHARPRDLELAALAKAYKPGSGPGAVDVWLASPKCALVLEAARIPHAVLDHSLILGRPLTAALVDLADLGSFHARLDATDLSSHTSQTSGVRTKRAGKDGSQAAFRRSP